MILAISSAHSHSAGMGDSFIDALDRYGVENAIREVNDLRIKLLPDTPDKQRLLTVTEVRQGELWVNGRRGFDSDAGYTLEVDPVTLLVLTGDSHGQANAYITAAQRLEIERKDFTSYWMDADLPTVNESGDPLRPR